MKPSKFYIQKQGLLKEIELQEKLLSYSLKKPIRITELLLSIDFFKGIGFSKPFAKQLLRKISKWQATCNKLKSISAIYKELQKITNQ